MEARCTKMRDRGRELVGHKVVKLWLERKERIFFF